MGKYGYKRRSSGGQLDEEVAGEGQYWAESVLDWCIDSSGDILYFIKWYHYPDDQNTWEVQQHINGCDELLIEFHLNHINGRHPPKNSFDEFDKLLVYLNDLVDRQDLAVLRRLSKNPIDCFQIRSNKVIEDIKAVINTQIKIMSKHKQILTIKTNAERLKWREVVSQAIKTLNIKSNFGSVSDFFEFVDKRRDVLKELDIWHKTHNEVIKKQSNNRCISIVNDVDLEVPYLKAYITENIVDIQFGDDLVGFEDEEPLVGCECTDCFDQKDECCTAIVGFPMVYKSTGVLNNKFNSVIYECNSKCKCDDKCPNRQIQKGRQFDLQIFRSDSKKRGWGVRTLQDIPKGAFITHYAGEVLSLLEAEKRPTTYLFDMSAHLHSSEAEYTYVTDASQYGNITRFINHSCDPNCRVLFSWIKGSSNLFLPRIVLFAIKDIPPQQELTYNYSMDSAEHHTKQLPASPILKLCGGQSPSKRTSVSRSRRRAAFRQIDCECGAINCQKLMYS